MLRKWSITNFKSFNGRTDIDLAPITVLAGANSSGKSTIIQSILLLKQTLQYVPATRPIGLNGPLIKLGRFDDIKNIGSEGNVIELGWELDELSRYRSTSFNSPFHYYPYPARLEKATFHISFGLEPDLPKEGDQIDVTANLRQLQPVLLSVNATVSYFVGRDAGEQGREVASIALKKTKGSKNRTEAALPTDFPFQVTSDQASRRELLQQRPDAKLIGAHVRHFFPNQVGVSYNKTKDFARRVAKELSSTGRDYLYEPDFTTAKLAGQTITDLIQFFREVIDSIEGLEGPVAERFKQRFSEIAVAETSVPEFLLAVRDCIRKVEMKYRQLFRTSLTERQEDIETILTNSAPLPQEPGYDVGLPRMISAASDQAATFFQTAVRYLGPLRDEPRPVYPLEALVNLTDVGYRGEHTAAVLDLHKSRPISYIPSAGADRLTDATPVRATLHEAVVDWLSYLGVAQGVRTEDMGMIGHQLQVRTGDVSRDHDLTNVGVGVSQLLPIIVMALLAPEPSLLIFEQPELHLHPKVQARLADFFVSLGVLGKQCLLETHSEYLVDRLRRRIAEADGERLNSIIKIYFTQKVGGHTECKAVQLTAYGAILDWPSDFFDQSNSETELLLEAAQKKLNREREASRGK